MDKENMVHVQKLMLLNHERWLICIIYDNMDETRRLYAEKNYNPGTQRQMPSDSHHMWNPEKLIS